MLKDPAEAVAAMAKILEGWAAMQEHQAASQAEQLEALEALEAFEVVVEVCHCSREEWVVRLLPLLSGEAQQAAHSLPPSVRGVYQNFRKAVLDRTGYSPEEQRRRFHDLGMAEERCWIQGLCRP